MNFSEIDPEQAGDPPASPGPAEQGGGGAAGTPPDIEAKFDNVKRRTSGLEEEIDTYIESAEHDARSRAEGVVREARDLAETVEREARDRATALVAQAKREAEEIRNDATAVVDRSRERVNELMRLRQALFATLRETLGDFQNAIDRAEEERTFTDAATEQAEKEAAERAGAQAEAGAEESATPEAEESTEDEAPAAMPPTKPTAEPDAPAEDPDEMPPEVVGPRVKVEVATLRNYEAVNVIERELSALPATHGVYLRSFDDGMATFEAFGVNVNMLLTSMRAAFSIPFILRSADAGRLVLQVDEHAPHRGGN